MRRALASAGAAPEAVDYINAHGTSTPYNDKFETLAIKRSCFGDHAYKSPSVRPSSMTGHLLGAAGGIESVICVKTIQQGRIAPTMNLEETRSRLRPGLCPERRARGESPHRPEQQPRLWGQKRFRSFSAQCESRVHASVLMLSGVRPAHGPRAGRICRRRLRPAARLDWGGDPADAAARGIEPGFVYAVVRAESNFDPHARSGDGTRPDADQAGNAEGRYRPCPTNPPYGTGGRISAWASTRWPPSSKPDRQGRFLLSDAVGLGYRYGLV